jgi:hypothetical protein
MKDFGENDQRFFVNTWSKSAANRLEPGDVALGYDITTIPDDDIVEPSSLPSAILLKKKEDKQNKKRQSRRRGDGKSEGGRSTVVGTVDDIEEVQELEE